MNQSEHINELATALAKAQLLIQPADKDAANPFFKSKYATLRSIWISCKDALNKNGLAVTQTVEAEDKPILVTTLMHSSGQWIKSNYPITYKDPSPQAIGSALSYGRRYALAAMVGVVTDEDDDGNAAQGLSTDGPKVEFKTVASVATGAKKPGCISDKQASRLIMIATKNGFTEKAVIEHVMRNYHATTLLDLPWKAYEAVVNQFSQHVPIITNDTPPPKDEDFGF